MKWFTFEVTVKRYSSSTSYSQSTFFKVLSNDVDSALGIVNEHLEQNNKYYEDPKVERSSYLGDDCIILLSDPVAASEQYRQTREHYLEYVAMVGSMKSQMDLIEKGMANFVEDYAIFSGVLWENEEGKCKILSVDVKGL